MATTNFFYQSKRISVKSSNMHYIEQGEGDPILFIHGMPTSSHIWRNIIPAMSAYGRCIAPDLIGMGESDKPDISYRVFDHIEYITAFIDALKLRNLTLVLHGWGSVIGLAYAMQHPKNIKAIAFYEAYVGNVAEWKKFSLPMQEVNAFLNQKSMENFIMRDEKAIDKILYIAGLKKLNEAELKVYRQPFLQTKDRKPIWQYVQDSPYGKGDKNVVQLIQQYTGYLAHTGVPKLLLYSFPGFNTTIENIMWCRQHLKNLLAIEIGDGMHYIQEDNPQAFTQALLNWYTKLNSKSVSFA